MNATPEQSRYLVTLPPGQAAVCTDGMDFPILVKIRDGTEREVAAAPRTTDARSVVSPRSATCGTECGRRPCTLRDMRSAQRALDHLPWVRMWAELTVLAHLSGWPMPVPTPARIAQFRQLPARVSECAMSHAVDAAVAARGPAVGPVLSTAGLAEHACAAIRARAERDQWLCPPGEQRWRMAGPVTEAAAFGVHRPSAIEAAGVAQESGATGPLTALLGAFIDCRWPVPYLRRSAAEQAPSATQAVAEPPGIRTTRARP